MKKIIKIGVVFFSLLILGSCTSGWEKLNIDPNNASNVPASSILINTERAMTELFNDMWWTGNNTTAYAGQVCKIQYIDENRYQERSTIVERWGTIMGYQVDLDQIVKKAQAAENPALEGVALTLKAMLWQIMTDTYEAVPFTEGGRGTEGVEFLHPDYDSQDVVYAGILTMLDDANALLAQGGTIQSDIINNNNVLLWQKFCNSLHLRVAIRMSNVAPATAKAELQKILATPATYPILSSNADLIALEWLGTSPYEEPWYEDRESPRDDHGMCVTFVDALNATADPRLPVFANRATSDNAYRGAISGMTPTQQQNMAIADISRVGDYFRARAAGTNYYMRYAEVEFIKAEAYARADLLNDAAAAQTAYEAGITASCTELGVAPAAITTYLADLNVGWSLAGGSFGYSNLQKIYYQKWIALFKQGHELWAETRRTDIPALTAAPGSIYTGHNRPPFRWPYPASEYTLNEAVVTANDAAIVDEFWGDKMWWDTRTGVN